MLPKGMQPMAQMVSGELGDRQRQAAEELNERITGAFAPGKKEEMTCSIILILWDA